MLFGETVAVYCENHTEHTDTLCGQNTIHTNPVRTSQETHNVSTTKPNRLMLFGETVAVYCENHTEHTTTLCGQNAEI
jgi:translation initiation factor IF-1